MLSPDKRTHAKINLNFGDGRLKMSFEPMRREWNISDTVEDDRASQDGSAMGNSSMGISQLDPSKLAELNERQNELTKELKMLKDCRQRLHIHS